MARRKKRHKARCIREYRRIAQQNHGWCRMCHGEIEAGDEYVGFVYVNGRELWVSKEHMYCLPWDVDEYREYDEDKTSVEEDLAEAA